MTPPRWYSLKQLSRATGLPSRSIRTLLDRRLIHFVQYQPNDKRLLNDRTVADLERLGIYVDRTTLAGNLGNPGNPGNPGELGEIRGHDEPNGE